MTTQEQIEQFDKEFIRDDGLLEKYDAPDIKTFLLQSHIQSLQQLHDEVGEMEKDEYFIGEDPENEEMREFTKEEGRFWGEDMSFAYNQSIKDIQNKLTKEIEALQALMK